MAEGALNPGYLDKSGKDTEKSVYSLQRGVQPPPYSERDSTYDQLDDDGYMTAVPDYENATMWTSEYKSTNAE